VSQEHNFFTLQQATHVATTLI